MMKSLKQQFGCQIQARGCDIGTVEDFLFDDRTWRIRFLVVDPEPRLGERPILLPPESFAPASDDGRRGLTLRGETAAVDNAPTFEEYRPLFLRPSAAPRLLYLGGGEFLWAESVPRAAWRSRTWSGEDPHLRSVREIIGYSIQGSDCRIGRVRDLLVNGQNWKIGALCLALSRRARNQLRLIPADKVCCLSWFEATVEVEATCSEIEHFEPFPQG